MPNVTPSYSQAVEAAKQTKEGFLAWCEQNRKDGEFTNLWNSSTVREDIMARYILSAPPPHEPAVPGGDGWRPIETAPKDGRTILLGYFNSAGKWRTIRGQWMSESYIADQWEEPDDAEPGWYETVVECDEPPNCWKTNPTHWQPLPIPPNTHAKEE